jgi:hypothetical protein
MKRRAPTKKIFLKPHVLFNTFGSILLVAITAWSSGVFSTSIVSQLQKNADDYDQRKERLRNHQISLENRTNGLQIVNLDKQIDQEIILITLKNTYQKPITGYKLSVGIGIQYGERQNSRILPGDEFRVILPLQPELDTKGVRILAVIFDDETTDGDPLFIKQIKDRRKGASLQRERNLLLLQQAPSVNK